MLSGRSNATTLREVSNVNSIAEFDNCRPAVRSQIVPGARPVVRSLPSSRSNSPNADRRHRRDPTYCADMIADITEMFLAREKQMSRRATYLESQPEINEKMRMILVDWLVDVHLKFKMHPETMFLAVDIVDRYLAVSKVTRSMLQLVGITSMLLAAKYEEIWPPEVKECIHISANTYSRDDILKMERDITAALQFRLTVPTTFPFAARLLDVIEADATVRHATHFFLEHAALDYKCLNFYPSQIANASILLANLMAGREPWNSTLQHYSKSRYSDVKGCAQHLLEFVSFSSTTKYQAIRRKYSNLKYGEVTKLAIPTSLPDMA